MSKVSERLRCCLCGLTTDEASDYLEMELTPPSGQPAPIFGVHANHLAAHLAAGFRIEIDFDDVE